MKTFFVLAISGLLLLAVPLPSGTLGAEPQKDKQTKPELKQPSDHDADRTTMDIADEVRHQLVTLPYYGVFDWLEGTVEPNRTVVLRGEVTRPTTKSDAEKRVKSLESVENVKNEIEVLPVSQNDDQIRRQVYRAIYNFDSPLFQYAIRAVPPIHIIVKGGRVTLKGVVINDMDRQLAETAARNVPNVFEVTNELKVEKSSSRR